MKSYILPALTLAASAISATVATPAVATTTTSVASSESEPTWLTGINTGDATWYDPDLGACGIVNTVTDYIVAISYIIFDEFPGYNGGNPNTNPICNKQITVTYQGVSATFTITDRCTGCDQNDLDLTPAGFSIFAPLGDGRLTGITWEFIDP